MTKIKGGLNLLIVMALFSVFSSACASGHLPASSATSTSVLLTNTRSSTATLTHIPSPTASSTPSPTFAPTPTPIPTPTLTPTLTPTPSPDDVLSSFLPTLQGKRGVVYRVRLLPEQDIEVTAYFVGYPRSVQISFAPDVYFGHPLRPYVQDIQGQDIGGNQLKFFPMQTGWQIEGRDQVFQVSYRVSREVPVPETGEYFVRIVNDGAFFYNQAVMGWLSPAPQAVYVLFDLPKGWALGTSFTPLGNRLFQVEGPDTLKRNLLLNITRAGVADWVDKKQCDDIHLTFIAFREGRQDDIFYEVPFEKQPQRIREYLDLMCKTIRYYKGIFGEWGGSYYYWSSTPAVIREFTTKYWAYWLQAWGRSRYSDAVHHILHAYIFGPQMGPSFLLFTSPDSWFGEGLPTFYEVAFTARLTRDSIWWGKAYVNYLSVKRAAQFHELRQRDYIVTYAYAQMQVLALDQEIRRLTNGEKTLDDLLRVLAVKYGKRGKGKPFGRNEVIKALYEITGKDWRDFYVRYLWGYVAPDLPPVDGFMAQHQKELFEWVHQYMKRFSPLPEDVGDSPSLYFTVLEMGIHQGDGETTHALFGGGPVEEEFREVCDFFSQRGPFEDEQSFTEALSQLVGVDESDFFDFYTIGEYRPTLEEINQWVMACHSPLSPKGGGNEVKGGGNGPLTNLAIKLDGSVNDWPSSLKPLATDPQDNTMYDFANLFAFADAENLYLRIDFYTPLPENLQSQFTFEIATEKVRFQGSIDTEDSATFHLIPYNEQGELLFNQQTMYPGAAIGKDAVEVVIPLRYLGQPDVLSLKVYAIATEGSTIFDSFPEVTFHR